MSENSGSGGDPSKAPFGKLFGEWGFQSSPDLGSAEQTYYPMPDEESREIPKELTEGAPLDTVIAFLNQLTGERNREQLPMITDRMKHLLEGAIDLQVVATPVELKKLGLTEDERIKLFRPVAAKYALRIFTALQGLGSTEEFTKSLFEQYHKCHRCGAYPCTCFWDKNMASEFPKPGEPITPTSNISSWQEHFKWLYGQNNAKLSQLELASKIVIESKEASSAAGLMSDAIRNGESRETIETYRLHAISELAQCLAWLLGLCVHPSVQIDGGKEITLDQVIALLYGKESPAPSSKIFTRVEPRYEFADKEKRDALFAQLGIG